MPLSNLDLSMWDRRCGLWKYPSLCFGVSYPAFSVSCRALCASNGKDEAELQPHKANVSVPNSTWSETVFATSEWHQSCETRAAGFFGTRMPSYFFMTLKFGKSPAAMPGQIREAWNMCPNKKEGYAMVTGRHHLRVVVVLLVLPLVLLHLGAPQLGSPSEAQHAVLGSASMPSFMQRSGGVTPILSTHTPGPPAGMPGARPGSRVSLHMAKRALLT